jgi:peptidoglycan biosynthesis protein MviN/MurJ (putative lipid II flippase)
MVKLGLGILLVGQIGIAAVAVSSVVSVTVTSIMMLVMLNRSLERPFGGSFIWAAVRICAVGTATAGGVALLRLMWPKWPGFLAGFGELAVLSVAGALIFSFLGYILLRQELGYFRKLEK